jgi:hypothetical protein
MPAPYGECQRCGFKCRLNELRTEWTGLKVCAPCRDPRPSEHRPPSVSAEGVPLPNASPATEPVFRVGKGNKSEL